MPMRSIQRDNGRCRTRGRAGALRRSSLSVAAESMEQAANRIVGYFYEQFVDEQTGEPACALVRFYKTHPYEGLTPELRAFAGSVLGHDPESPHMKCLTLMASDGARPEWNERHTSVGHQA